MFHTLYIVFEKVSLRIGRLRVKARNNIAGLFVKLDTLKFYDVAMITMLQYWKSLLFVHATLKCNIWTYQNRCSFKLNIKIGAVVLKLEVIADNIRGHKGQNSAETRCRGFLVLESRCRGFSALESRCRGFLSSEKMSWNHDVVG